MGILDGKAAIVTGGGRGIGRGHCLHLAEQGACVIVNDIDEGEAKKVVEEIAGSGGKAEANTSNISTREGAQELIAHCVDSFGAIHAAVNNAGNVKDRSFLKMSDEEFDSVVQVHVYGTFRVAQEACLRFKEQGTGGAIVNTVSAAHYGNFGQTNYAGSKGMIASMTYTWALELARYGIRVNAISPSGTTRMSASAKIGGKTVELPFIDPNQNGAFVAFLCSDEASWVTGQIFGSGADRAQIVDQPSYGTAMYLAGGLTVDGLVQNFKKVFDKKLHNFGLMKTPYAFYDGVKVPEKE
jgi:NAD(P)-dependent dehydrogenase (short-subunit alcohol dehydrogenase family)